MNSYISELNDYLELYGVLLENKMYSQEKGEDAKELIELINKLKEQGPTKDYDFSYLKRKISKIFHPDIYTSFNTESIGIDNKKLLSKVNNVLDEIIKEKKTSSFAYGEQEPFNESYGEDGFDYTKNDYFGKEQKFTPKPKTEAQLRKERFNETVEEVKNEVVRTTEYISTIARERFNAIFKGIPANTTDYINIKKRFEDALMSLTYRDSVIASTLNLLYHAKNVLNDTYAKEISPLALTYFYNNEVSNAQRRMDMAEAVLNQAKVNYYQVFDKYAPEYKELMGRWVSTRSEIFADMININMMINEEVSKHSKERVIKQLLNKRKRLDKEQDKYPKYEEIKEKIKAYMLDKHPDLKEVYVTYKDEQEKCNIARNDYLYITHNSKNVKADRLRQVTEEYKKRTVSMDQKIARLEGEHKAKAARIFKTRMKYNEFLDRYQNKYENRLEYDDMVEISVKR